MDLMELFNLAVLLGFIFFSAWAFYLKFKANKVTTTRDLLHAFITGGILAVTTMVFGVSNDIINASNAIKEDTVSIRATLEGNGTESRGETQALPPNEQLAELLRINQQQTQMLRRLSGTTESLVEKIDLNNRLISLILEAPGSSQGFPTESSGSGFTINLDLICSAPQPQPQTRLSAARLSPRCVIKPSE